MISSGRLLCRVTKVMQVLHHNVHQLAKKYGIKVFYDSARFAENAYFIKTREKQYERKTIREIAREMFSYADGMTMSSKKDAIVNIGGFIGLRDVELFRKASEEFMI